MKYSKQALPQEKIRIGIIGTGAISAVHLRSFLNDPRVTVCALADVDRSRVTAAAREIPDCSVYTNYHDILERNDIDVVDILLPHSLHAEVICEALRYGKHVICEKPLVTNSKDIDRISKLAESTGKRVYVKQYFRFSAIHAKLRDDILNGAIGRPYLISCIYTTNDVAAFENIQSWKFTLKSGGGGIWMDVGVHILDYLSEIFGNPISISAVMKKIISSAPGKSEDVAVVTLEFRLGIVASILCTAGDTSIGFGWEKHFYGSSGSLHLIDNGKQSSSLTLTRSHKVVQTGQEALWWELANRQALADITGRILRNEPPAVLLSQTKTLLKVIEGAYRSAKSGNKIQLTKVGAYD